MGSVKECTTKSDFDAALKSAGSKLVVVDFTASWCGPCKMIKPYFDELARKHTGSIFLKVDVDANRATAQAFSVSAMPTFLFFKNGSVIDTLRGADKNRLSSKVEQYSSGSSSGAGSAFAGKGNTLAGGSQPAFRRHNAFGEDSDEEEGSIDPSSTTAADAVDPEVEAFLASQRKTLRTEDDDIDARMREERIRTGGLKTTKSRYQREREEAEKKKAAQEEEAARAYKEFVEAMEGGAERAGQSGSSRYMGPAGSTASKSKPIGFVSAGGGSSYNPARKPPAHSPSTSTAPDSAAVSTSRSFGGMFGDDDDDDEEKKLKQKDQEVAAKARREPPIKRKGAMGDFLGELQKEQAQREERYKDKIAEGKSVSSILALEGQKVGSRDSGDPLTTNVCTLNLPANISEKALGEFFSQWGDIGTVKIMWPRGDDVHGGAGGGITSLRNTRSAGLTGFVCFMERADAEFACREADGITWGGCILRTSWGKAMPKPANPFYLRPKGAQKRHRSRSASPPPTWAKRRSSLSPSSRKHRRTARSPSPRTQLKQYIESSEGQGVIQSVAARVREYGPSFESMVRDKERDNPKFDWLRDESSMEGQYYQTLLNSRYIPELPSKPFEDDGNASLYDSDSEEDSEAERLRKLRRTDVLGKASRRRFEAMLRGITLRRERIAGAMLFALEHAHAADTICDILVQSLLIPSTPVPRKLARLYVVSDILHNSAAPLPNAWRYRSGFEARIGAIFSHFGDVAKSFPGLMKQEGFKTQIRALLEVWDSWMVFPPATLEELSTGLERGSKGAGSTGAAAIGQGITGGDEAHGNVEERWTDGDDADADVDGEGFGVHAADVRQTADTDQQDEEDEDVDGEAL